MNLRAINLWMGCVAAIVFSKPSQAADREILGSDTLQQVTQFLLKLDPATAGFTNPAVLSAEIQRLTGLTAAHPLVMRLTDQWGRSCGPLAYPVTTSSDGENAMCANLQFGHVEHRKSLVVGCAIVGQTSAARRIEKIF